MKSFQCLLSYLFNIPSSPHEVYRSKKRLNGQLCDTAISENPVNFSELLFIIRRLTATLNLIYKPIHVYYCRNTTQIPELCDRTVALHPYTGCYATPVVH